LLLLKFQHSYDRRGRKRVDEKEETGKGDNKRKYNGMETAIMRFLGHFESIFTTHISLRTNNNYIKWEGGGSKFFRILLSVYKRIGLHMRKNVIIKWFSLFYASYKIFLSNQSSI